ncbi:MAG: hypothetical protein E7031_02085 [Akkermansiaceae bacterium]|nr:hypothetical protein [Akkermansiaceae bacterium]
MSKVGAPDFSAFVSYLIAWEKARKTGNPAPPMPWKEDNLTLLPVTNAPIQPRAMPYSPARRYDEGDTGNRNRLRQMIAMKRQIELELIHFAETELLRC